MLHEKKNELKTMAKEEKLRWKKKVKKRRQKKRLTDTQKLQPYVCGIATVGFVFLVLYIHFKQKKVVIHFNVALIRNHNQNVLHTPINSELINDHDVFQFIFIAYAFCFCKQCYCYYCWMHFLKRKKNCGEMNDRLHDESPI